jgi:hypothetical protein
MVEFSGYFKTAREAGNEMGTRPKAAIELSPSRDEYDEKPVLDPLN